MTHYFTWNNPRAVVLCTLLLISMLAFLPSSASAQDFTITTTADFDAGTPTISDRVRDIETNSDSPKVSAGEIQVASDFGDGFSEESEDVFTWRWKEHAQLLVGNPNSAWVESDINQTTAGKLRLGLNGATANCGWSVYSNNALTGDFDIQVKVDVASLPDTDAGWVYFGVYKKDGTNMDYDNRALIRRYYSATHNLQSRAGPGGTIQTLPTTDNSFSLRLTRTGTTIYYYYDLAQGEDWTAFGSVVLAGLGDVNVGLSVATSVGWPYVAADFDDFKVNSGTFVGDGYIGASVSEHFNDPYSGNPFDLPGGENQAVHPDVLYFPDGEDGYKFWMYYNPMPTAYEHAWLVRSNDGITWVETGVSNPIVAIPGAGWGSTWVIGDTDVVKVGSDWFLYFIGKNDVSGVMEIGYATSSDGKTFAWGGLCIGEAAFFAVTGQDVFGLTTPAAVYRTFDSTFYMYFVVREDGGLYDGKQTIRYATSADGVAYTVQNVRLLLPGGLGEWYLAGAFHHIDVFLHTDGTLFMSGNTGDGKHHRYKLGLATSTDYITWTRHYREPIFNGDDTDWDERMYRSSMVEVGEEVWLYYSAYENGGSPVFGIGLVKSKAPSWESATQTMLPGKRLFDTTIYHSGLSDTVYIEKVEWLLGGVIKATYDTKITSGASTTIEEPTSGSFKDVDDDFTIKVYLVAAASSPAVTQIEGTYTDATIPTGEANYDCDFQATIDAYNVSFQASCDRDDALILHWIWDFDDGTVLYDDASTIDHEYSQTGSFNVSLEVIDHDGRTASVSKWVTIEANSPSGFYWSGMVEVIYWVGATIILMVILVMLARRWKKEEET